MMISEILPKHPKVSFDLINRVLTKKEISNTIDVVYRHCGQKKTVIFADKLMEIGFREACKVGISFADDLLIPSNKMICYLRQKKLNFTKNSIQKVLSQEVRNITKLLMPGPNVRIGLQKK